MENRASTLADDERKKMGVGEWFSDFCGNIRIDLKKRQSFGYRTGRITKVLNVDFRSLDSDTANRFYVGSMGRSTAIPSVSDVDLLYVLPYATYEKYDAYSGNKQSALLSAVRAAVQKTYSTSAIFGDGQVVAIAFDDGVTYELLPAFLNKDGSYTFADSNNGGSWRVCNPKKEMDAFSARNSLCKGNLVELARMARAWRDYNSVPMGGMLLDTLAYQFIESWAHRDKSYLYYDYMTRDFFNFLANQISSQQHWLAPGSGSYVYRKGPFEYKARQAELRALEALEYLKGGYERSAKQKFREIYGPTFPA
ncbi:nucleotidyltransferase [Aquabacterium sp.]|uniref:SMODS domain-containing nucleotidyltransferase n=1 Tax=Aquabacterium sp. TaxID=1872578 RepID=UPI00248877A3|nr:nucleotidyltransferase [Aquabacterium sp.]MDI1258296.1 nucleotidyltransferase [Aquabacterium sp.]